MLPVNTDNFTSFFPFWFPFIFLPDSSGSDFQYYVEYKSRILIFFLILEGKLSIFHHQIWYWLWGFHILPLLCWDNFSLWVVFIMQDVELCQMCFQQQLRWLCGFFLHSVDVEYFVSWFSYGEPSLHSRNKSHLITVFDSFTMLLNSVC